MPQGEGLTAFLQIGVMVRLSRRTESRAGKRFTGRQGGKRLDRLSVVFSPVVPSNAVYRRNRHPYPTHGVRMFLFPVVSAAYDWSKRQRVGVVGNSFQANTTCGRSRKKGVPCRIPYLAS